MEDRKPQFLRVFAKSVIFILFICILLTVSALADSSSNQIRVGIFQNKPLSFLDEQGSPQGIVPDLIHEIAEKKKWNITYIQDSWSGCLEKLKTSEIDLMISIVYTPKRDVIFDFSKEAVVTSWGQVYTDHNSDIETIVDLDGRTVAVMKNDINGRNFKDLCAKFDIQPEFVTFKNYDDLCHAIISNHADAGIINNIAGTEFKRKYEIHPTPIMFSPVSSVFATSQGKNLHLLSAIDQHLSAWKKDKHSVYYEILDKWYGNTGSPFTRYYKIIITTLIVLGALALFLLIWTTMLRKKVHARTKDLKESEQRFKTLVEQAADAIFIFDSNGKILEVNHQACQSLGYNRGDFKSMSIQDIETDSFDTDIYQQLWIKPACETTLSFEGHHRKKDGSVFPVEVRARLLNISSGRCVMALVSDITTRKKAEAVLRQSHEDLERRVKNRTIQLEAANKELDAFAYSVSHDLRAPLRGIDGFSLALIEDYEEGLDETGKNYLNRIRKGCLKMGNLIDDILKLSRLSRGKIKKERLDISEIASNILDELKQESPDRDLKITVLNDMVAMGDPALVKIVFENLLGNAWKFTSKTKDAHISVDMQEKNDRQCIVIQDNGAGFDMEYSNKLFSAFQRLHTPQEFEGTGIGLATVQRIIHRHGGSILAEGEVQKGASFYLSFS